MKPKYIYIALVTIFLTAVFHPVALASDNNTNQQSQDTNSSLYRGSGR